MNSFEPIIFQSPPSIPEGITEVLRYKLEAKSYKDRTRAILYIFLEIIGALFVIGLLWINIDWIRLGVTIVVILTSLILLLALTYIL